MDPLNRKKVKKLLKEIKDQFDCEIPDNYYFFKTKKDKINIINQDFSKIDTKNLKILNIGLYFAKPEKDGIRLTIEGSNLIKNPKKNVITLNKEEYEAYMQGENIPKEDTTGWKLVKYQNEFLGTGKLANNILINYIPKERRAK
jgi:NOL1/NOP2/fmu family ribosome biogenesis protein